MLEEGRFASTIPFYVRYRPRYPASLIGAVAQELGLDGTGRLLDLGCGPGFVAIALAPYVGEVVGVDPEPRMIEAAEAEAAAAGREVTFVLGRAESLDSGFGRFRAATMGRSFHWMDRSLTLAILDQLIEAGGAVVLLRNRAPRDPLSTKRSKDVGLPGGTVAVLGRTNVVPASRARCRTMSAVNDSPPTMTESLPRNCLSTSSAALRNDVLFDGSCSSCIR